VAKFPAPGKFEIKSNPIFLISVGDRHEVVVFDATMQVDTARPTSTASGKRQVEVRVNEWLARGRSQVLGEEIVLRLEGRQPKSRVTAQTTRDDLPGRLQFGMNWTAEAGGRKVEGLRGQATGRISTFPPRSDDIFDIRGKEVQIGSIKVQPIACAC
jgi:hypothetical protein